MNLLPLAFTVLALMPGNLYVTAWPSLVELGGAGQTYYQPQPAQASVQPLKTGGQNLSLKAKAAIAIDKASGRVLYTQNADAKLPIASITKLATVVTTMHNHRLDQIVTIPKLPSYKPEDEVVGLQAGERYSIRDLITAALVGSGNDAADALAIMDSGSKEAFSTNMNQLLNEWGIKDVQFSNPSGLSDVGNSASARAVAQMGLLVTHNSDVSKLINTKSTTITSQGGRILPITTTNQLLQSGRFSGIKTGYTLAAGECFVGLANIDGHQVVTVVLGSPDRFGESNQLAEWITRNYQWQ